MTHSTTPFRSHIVAVVLLICILMSPSLLHAQSLLSSQEAAVTAFQSGDYDTAYAHLSSIISRDTPRDGVPAQAYLLKALIERQNKAYTESISTFEQGLAHHPSHRDLMMELAVTYSWSERVEEALVLYERILQDSPSDLAAKQGLARMLSWSGRHDEALVLYTQMLDIPEARQQALLGMAFVYRARGRRQLARRHYEIVLEEHSSHPEALDGLEAVEAMKVGRIFYQVGAARTRSGDSSLEMRAGLLIQPVSAWMCTLDYVIRSDSFALVTATPQQSLHQSEAGVSRSIGSSHRLGLRLGYQFDTHGLVVGAEGSARLAETLFLSYGLRHQTATAHAPDVQVYRLGVSHLVTPRQELLVQAFASTFESTRPESIALSTRHQLTWLDGRIMLGNTLAPELSRTQGAGVFGESSLRLSTHVWSIELGAQAGFRRTPFVGLRTALTRAF